MVTSQQGPGILMSPPLQSWDYRHAKQHSTFTGVLGMPSQILLLTQQSLLMDDRLIALVPGYMM